MMFSSSYWINLFESFPWEDAGIACLIFLIFLLLRKMFTKYIFKLIVRLSKKTPTEFFTNLLLAFERPMRTFFVAIGAYLALVYLPFNITTIVLVKQIYQSIIFFLIGWGLYNFTSENSLVLTTLSKRFELDQDSMLVPFLSKIIRFGIIALTFAVVLDVWGYNIGAFIAGLGLGGLAFALAAQDTIANFFGGIVIIVEKPFKKGDWILTPTVEGTVEDITFRSTTIRTFADSLVTVPNSKLANEAITNWSQMRKRQISFQLGISHQTPSEKINIVTEKIEKMLREHEGVDQSTIIVRFREFNVSSLDLFIYFFTKSTALAEHLAVREDINLKIMKILEQEGVKIALPIYFEKNY